MIIEAILIKKLSPIELHLLCEKYDRGQIIGTCKDAACVENIFGSVSEFARQIELHGDEFTYQGIAITYNEKTDTHTFTAIPTPLAEVAEKNLMVLVSMDVIAGCLS